MDDHTDENDEDEGLEPIFDEGLEPIFDEGLEPIFAPIEGEGVAERLFVWVDAGFYPCAPGWITYGFPYPEMQFDVIGWAAKVVDLAQAAVDGPEVLAAAIRETPRYEPVIFTGGIAESASNQMKFRRGRVKRFRQRFRRRGRFVGDDVF